MPMLGGWETAKILRKNKITNVPIIIISADANERMQNPETDVLNEDFLVKPVDLNLLLNKVGDKLGLKWIQQKDAVKLLDAEPNEPVNAVQIVEPAQIENKIEIQSLHLEDAIEQLKQHLEIGYIRGAKQQLTQC